MIRLCGFLLVFAVSAVAGDWPGILGPLGNGSAPDEELADSWPEGGPRLVWTARTGEGFAGPAVRGGDVLVWDRVGDRERLRALVATNGAPRWSAEFPARYRPSLNPDAGPRCVPATDAERAFVFGAGGDLHALRRADGKTLWSRALGTETKADGGYFGAGHSPVLVGGTLIVNVGGRDAGIVGVDPDTGRTRWSATDERASYSTTAAWGDRAIVVTRMHAVALSPADGRVLWRIPFGARGPTVNGAAPLVSGDHLFLSAAYRVGAQWHDLGGDAPRLVWANDSSLSSQYPTPVIVDGHLYGTHGREDFGDGVYRCVETATGEVRWTAGGFGMAHTIAADGKLVIHNIDGRLVLARPSPERFEPLSEARVAGFSRALPALADGLLYLRETNEGKPGRLLCLRVGP